MSRTFINNEAKYDVSIPKFLHVEKAYWGSERNNKVFISIPGSKAVFLDEENAYALVDYILDILEDDNRRYNEYNGNQG